eukprot:gnl/MRDRNA2_/MRDRNA2_33661_c0_seq1.p1 gnl/MRDRNA2_/MRDRNA2_33661_c0~~gnl/MRDRNA2_/MRDRNA2_33661_c0_seq1.p1  ORF type:complete len:280 (+),score=45.64 gnl/MRDRNA2_/MRDRNA2_33661_c0_seq1:85-924(+)
MHSATFVVLLACRAQAYGVETAKSYSEQTEVDKLVGTFLDTLVDQPLKAWSMRRGSVSSSPFLFRSAFSLPRFRPSSHAQDHQYHSLPAKVPMKKTHRLGSGALSRRGLLFGMAGMLSAGRAPLGQATVPAALSASPLEKQRNLAADKLAALVTADIAERQFLVTGDITRSIYDESCTFQDEIDTYTLEKWVKGTSSLFAGACSHVDIVGPVTADESTVRFRFSETLTFNIPVLLPKVPLTGELVLTRGTDGLITSYKEIWDEPVSKVLSNVKLFGCSA